LYAGFESARYKDPEQWLCWPGRADVCAQSLDATELLQDGTRAVVQGVPASSAAKVDCFYVYPTVDRRLIAANHTDFADLAPMSRATLAQAAWFRNVCRLYVPLYRQITLGTYLRKSDVKQRYTDVAASDVVDAFLHYMGQENRGRPIVLLGHSQGAEMVVHLLERLFDADPVMRQRLLIAMPIGWMIEVPKGRSVGGTFASIPLCTRAGQTGCIVAYRSFVAGSDAEPHASPAPGNDCACVNPAELAHGAPHPFSRTFFPMRSQLEGVDGVTTPFVLLRDFYTGRCATGEDGYHYLAVSETGAPGDPRKSPIDLSRPLLNGRMGLHLLDYQFPLGDLLDLVSERAATLE
jgi:hypothetical protein